MATRLNGRPSVYCCDSCVRCRVFCFGVRSMSVTATTSSVCAFGQVREGPSAGIAWGVVSIPPLSARCAWIKVWPPRWVCGIPSYSLPSGTGRLLRLSRSGTATPWRKDRRDLTPVCEDIFTARLSMADSRRAAPVEIRSALLCLTRRLPPANSSGLGVKSHRAGPCC